MVLSFNSNDGRLFAEQISPIKISKTAVTYFIMIFRTDMFNELKWNSKIKIYSPVAIGGAVGRLLGRKD